MSSILKRAQAALASGRYAEARSTAIALLDRRISKEDKAAALLIVADAAYAMGSYGEAAARYRELLSQPNVPRDEAVRATMALGWAELRSGHRVAARQVWAQLAERFPHDARAALALLLASEVASQDGDPTATASIDRLVARYPSSIHGATAKLNRSIRALRAERTDAAVRDLDDAIRSHGESVIAHRRRVMEALTTPRAEAALVTAASAAPTTPGETSLAQFAASFLSTGDRANAPYVLHGLALLAAADGGWSDAVAADLVHRLVQESPSYPPAPALLMRVATAAASAGQWPTARRAYETLVTRYPDNPLSTSARMDLAEGLIRAGARTEARAYLERAAATPGAQRPQALLRLSEVEESLGNREKAPVLLQQIVTQFDGDVAGEAAYRLGRMLSAAGKHEAAVEWQLTAAYVAENSRWGRRALLDAGQSLTTLKRTNEALMVYRKLVPKPFAREAQARADLAASLPHVDAPEDRELMGEAAYRIAEILNGIGDQDAALDMYLTSAHLAVGRNVGRALFGAMRSFVTMGDRSSAEAIYRRLLESTDSDPALLAEARKTLRLRGSTVPEGVSALPRSTQTE